MSKVTKMYVEISVPLKKEMGRRKSFLPGLESDIKSHKNSKSEQQDK